MFLQYLSLLHFFLLLPPVSSSLIAKPGCPDQRGNLSIPYPFGVGSGCSAGSSFDIICNHSNNPAKPYLSISNNTEVVEINPFQIRVKYPKLALAACYNLSESKQLEMSYSFYIELWATQYTLSDENWLTAVGCDDMVAVIGISNESYSGGCVSNCDFGYDSAGNGSCGNGYELGNGCCRIPIPRGTMYLDVNLTDVHDKWWRGRKLFPCSLAFIQEKSNRSGFSYPLSLLNDSTAFQNDDWAPTSTLPAVRLDWRIGIENCSRARRNSTAYACQDNSFCVDFDAIVNSPYTTQGYLCRCLQGYAGNPYLIGGCRDIDECADSTTNPCDPNSDCINTIGSFKCSCRRGFSGDGTKDGTGCSRLQQSQSKMIFSIGLGSGVGFTLLILTCIWSHKILQKRENKMQKERFFKRNGGLLLQQQTSNEGTIGKTRLFPAKELENATDHFNESRILGQGGQGTVYKGMLSDGRIVAIKKSKLVDEDLLEQFINEVVILTQINHRNVVKLLGCCLETEVPLLVYEFMPNGTLFDLIHDPSPEFPISWNIRLKIAADIAGALAYLHSASSLPIYHRDIKSSNILLDEKYVVKVSDFGTSRSVTVDQTHLTTLVKGTFGYLDPEYFQSSQFTEKSDVYSFGVVLVELLTGKRPISLERTKEERSLATRFLASMEANNLDTILDPQVSEQGRKEQVIAVACLARRCLNLKGKMRPTMKEVAIELESSRISEMPSVVKDESKEVRKREAKPMMISDIEYTWTTSGNIVNSSSSSSDACPLIFSTM